MPPKRGSKAVWIAGRVLDAVEPLREAASKDRPRPVPMAQFIEETLWALARGELIKRGFSDPASHSAWDAIPPSSDNLLNHRKGKKLERGKASGE